MHSFLIALMSVITGITVSLIFMWPFALVAIGRVPLMGFVASMRMKQMLGEDRGNDNAQSGGQDELHSPGGILVETLINIITVLAALHLEEEHDELDFNNAILEAQPNFVSDGIFAGITNGIFARVTNGSAVCIQQWINALQFYFGGWLLFNYRHFTFNDFMISMLSVMLSLFGMGAAFNGLSDCKETEASAGRIFYLLDRKSAIDPLDESGWNKVGWCERNLAPSGGKEKE
jgi:ATP-binding cassette subfamily B (MDR/TAP) protein 1